MARPRIVDERTGKPADYEAILAESLALAKEEGIPAPAACKKIALLVCPKSADNIERRLRDMRNKRGASAASRSDTPPPGVWFLGSELEIYADRLQDEMVRIQKANTYSAHKMRVMLSRAECILAIVEQREFEIAPTTDENAAAHLSHLLQGLGESEPELDAMFFVGRERRAVEKIQLICGRIVDDATSALRWLEE